MATISFERNIQLTPKAVENIVKIANKPSMEMKNEVHALEKVNRGRSLLRQQFSR